MKKIKMTYNVVARLALTRGILLRKGTDCYYIEKDGVDYQVCVYRTYNLGLDAWLVAFDALEQRIADVLAYA